MDNNQEHRVPRWNQFWNRMRGDIGVRKVHGRRNRGFSLVELIIVIAIMAILAAGIAPALIRYINKARKADDIAAAETIGTTFRAAITSEEMLYEWVNACVAPGSLNPNWKDGRDYRIVAYSNVPTAAGFAPSDFHLLPLGSLQPEGDPNAFKQQMIDLLATNFVKLKFHTSPELDEWIIAVDKDRNLSIWVGGGLNDYRAWLSKDGVVFGNTSFKAYMLWPEVSPEYNQATTPSDLKH